MEMDLRVLVGRGTSIKTIECGRLECQSGGEEVMGQENQNLVNKHKFRLRGKEIPR